MNLDQAHVIQENANEIEISVNHLVGASLTNTEENIDTKPSIWNEILNGKVLFNWNDFFYDLILGFAPSAWDMGTDFYFAAELLDTDREEDVLAAGLCYIFITLPVFFLAFNSIPITAHVVSRHCLRYEKLGTFKKQIKNEIMKSLTKVSICNARQTVILEIHSCILCFTRKVARFAGLF